MLRSEDTGLRFVRQRREVDHVYRIGLREDVRNGI